MRVETYGRVQIFRWSREIEQDMRQAAREHLLAKFRPGEFRDARIANAIVQHQFAFYAGRLADLVPRVATRDALEFVLTQYEVAATIIHGKDIHDQGQRERWLHIEGNFRRSMKYLAELICLWAPYGPVRTSRREAARAMDQALLCADSLVDLAEMSNRVHGVFPDDSVAVIHREGGPLDWEVYVAGRYTGYDLDLMARVKRDREHRHEFISGHQFDIHTERHMAVLDPAFEKCYGWSYGHFISGIGRVIDGCKPAPDGFPTLFVHRENLIDIFRKHGEPLAAVEKMLAGFTVYPAQMEREGRAVWNPKQEHRAYRRGFLEFPHKTGLHIAFSREMARESLIHLVNSVCYRRLPEDWRHPEISAALESLSGQASRWFESVVAENLAKLGIKGHRVKGRVGFSQDAPVVPEGVGEIDFLGYEPKERLLVLAEAKMVLSGLEGKFWRDDVSAFVTSKGSYAEKFRRKIVWVCEQRSQLAAALGLPSDVRVVPAMFTLYPCIAKIFIQDFPCVSITEFMLDFHSKNRWPYGTPA